MKEKYNVAFCVCSILKLIQYYHEKIRDAKLQFDRQDFKLSIN